MTSRRQPLEGFDRALTPVVGCLAASLLMLLMLLTCVDVAARYFFNSPIYGGFEVTEMLLAAMIFAGLPVVTLRNEHVTVDLFEAITPDWLLRIQHAFACVVGLLCTGFVSYRLWILALDLDRKGQTTAELEFKASHLAYTMSILMALTAVALLVLALRRPRREAAEAAGV